MTKKFAKKSLGQNFLTSVVVRDKILQHAGNIRDKNILEIGPGLGFLTASILKKKANVTAIELDERAFQILNKNFEQNTRFHVKNQDILQTDIQDIYPENTPYAIIANIPYNITSPILKKFLSETSNKPEYMLLMVQKEVAEKVCLTKGHPVLDEIATENKNDLPTHSAPPNVSFNQHQNLGNKKRSLLQISVEVFAIAEYCFTVPRHCFDPIPGVDSAIMKLTLREKPLIPLEMEKDFFTVVQGGFNERRKKLGNHIGTFFGLESSKLLGNIDPNRRAEELSIEEWIAITTNFQKEMK